MYTFESLSSLLCYLALTETVFWLLYTVVFYCTFFFLFIHLHLLMDMIVAHCLSLVFVCTLQFSCFSFLCRIIWVTVMLLDAHPSVLRVLCKPHGCPPQATRRDHGTAPIHQVNPTNSLTVATLWFTYAVPIWKLVKSVMPPRSIKMYHVTL